MGQKSEGAQLVPLLWCHKAKTKVLAGLDSHLEFPGEQSLPSLFQTDSVPCSCRTDVPTNLLAVSREPLSALEGLLQSSWYCPLQL